MDDITSGLGKLLSDPDALAKISQLASSISKPSPAEEPAIPVQQPELPVRKAAVPALPVSSGRTELLYALKPLLSERRRAKVDGLIRAMGAVEVITALKNGKTE